MTITEVKVAEHRIVKEALQDNVLVACCPGVVDTTETIRLARRSRCVCGDVLRIVFDGVRHEHVILFPLTGFTDEALVIYG